MKTENALSESDSVSVCPCDCLSVCLSVSVSLCLSVYGPECLFSCECVRRAGRLCGDLDVSVCVNGFELSRLFFGILNAGELFF